MDFNNLIKIAEGMRKRFPEGYEPYQIATRLLEECGEVAAEVNHFENSGVKRLKRGEPSKAAMASEIRQAMNALVQLMLYYGLEEEFYREVNSALERLEKEGCIADGK